MGVVKIADLKNNLSRHLARVRRGQEITVFDRDAPIARIVPFIHGSTPARAGAARDGATDDRITDLARQGVIASGGPDALAQWLDDHPPVQLSPGSPSAVAALLTTRRESRR